MELEEHFANPELVETNEPRAIIGLQLSMPFCNNQLTACGKLVDKDMRFRERPIGRWP